jgi:hypothetical protein
LSSRRSASRTSGWSSATRICGVGVEFDNGPWVWWVRAEI